MLSFKILKESLVKSTRLPEAYTVISFSEIIKKSFESYYEFYRTCCKLLQTLI